MGMRWIGIDKQAREKIYWYDLALNSANETSSFSIV
jgi:hypothetical protein